MSKQKLRPVDYVVHDGQKITNVWLACGAVVQLKGHVPVKKALADAAEYYKESR